jgi:hypothetical protein
VSCYDRGDDLRGSDHGDSSFTTTTAIVSLRRPEDMNSLSVCLARATAA